MVGIGLAFQGKAGFHIGCDILYLLDCTGSISSTYPPTFGVASHLNFSHRNSHVNSVVSVLL